MVTDRRPHERAPIGSRLAVAQSDERNCADDIARPCVTISTDQVSAKTLLRRASGRNRRRVPTNVRGPPAPASRSAFCRSIA